MEHIETQIDLTNLQKQRFYEDFNKHLEDILLKRKTDSSVLNSNDKRQPLIKVIGIDEEVKNQGNLQINQD